ncbi:MAG TPA: fatty acid desaturase family protein [Burkholderiaceae bacterium]|nr:fatty acid desaturase family protein [Burkholderiaceae bacterium]
MSALTERSAAASHADYRLVGGRGEAAVAAGLANAEWYHCSVPRPAMKSLMQRSDARAVRDTLLWYALILLFGALGCAAWGTWWAVPVFLVYGALYGGAADSRWHECSHGTAFRTRWMNDVVYQLACFQVLRRPTAWRWSHARHHTDTLVTGRDPEIAVQRPVDPATLVANLVALKHGTHELARVVAHAAGSLDDEEKSFIPQVSWPNVVREARLWLLAYAALVVACLAMHSVLPAMLVGLPSFYGAWLYLFFGLTQHAGLPENVLDHRLNSRTVMMNPVFRFLYWNMNYHVEHHMFPMVPFHALPRLHEAIRSDCPPPYRSTLEAYREILPALRRQVRDPTFHVDRPLPGAASAGRAA